jgi:hypothetical protein
MPQKRHLVPNAFLHEAIAKGTSRIPLRQHDCAAKFADLKRLRRKHQSLLSPDVSVPK